MFIVFYILPQQINFMCINKNLIKAKAVQFENFLIRLDFPDGIFLSQIKKQWR